MPLYVLDRYRPQPSWYRHNPYGLHGLGHAARVLVWSEQIGQSLLEHGVPADVEVVRWAAALHDVGRISDGADLLHGERSAEWVRAHSHFFDSSLSAGQIEQLAYVCAWHVRADDSAPAMTRELTCLKDADGLDRVRIYDLDPRYLRTASARALQHLAQELFWSTRNRSDDPWEAVRGAAIGMGLWR